MTETRWIWLETPDGKHTWIPLSDVAQITKDSINDDWYMVSICLGERGRADNLVVRAFSVHASPAEIHPKKPPADGDTFSVQGP